MEEMFYKAFLNDESTQSALRLSVDHSTVVRRLQNMGNIQAAGKPLPFLIKHEPFL